MQVRFIKMRFTAEVLADTTLPREKVSALRGGMGSILLNRNCIRDGECSQCEFESECIVPRTLYSKYEIQPAFVTSDSSVGYLLECEDHVEHCRKGERFEFCLVLFGKALVHFNQYAATFFEMGRRCGIGRYHSKFRICKICNTEGQSLFEGGEWYMDRFVIHTLYDYVLYRSMGLGTDAQDYRIIFDTPLTLKYQGEYLQKFELQAIVEAVKRRLYMLNCFEGIDAHMEAVKEEVLPEFSYTEQHIEGISRYSSRKDTKMILRGIKGQTRISGLPEEVLQLLLVGELIHIGKNTSFGFGRYHVESGFPSVQ